MSGASGINPQGIDRKERDIFTFNDTILPVLSGGDFDSQELTIAAEVYSDLQLSDDIREGFDIHANSAKNLFPVSFCRICQGKVSDPPCAWCGGEAVIIPSTVTKEERYIGKNGFNFPLIYGAEPKSIHHNTHIDLEIVEYAFNKFFDRYKGAKSFRDKISKDFCSMVQPSGIGTEVIWNDPKEYIESLFGYKRYFDVENYITKQLFDLAQETRTRTRTSKVRVERKPGKLQTIWGATASSLYAAAFQIQAKNLRQSGNHVIQSTGAGITKNLQLAIWSIQPIGINDWKVCPYNVHDEIMVSNNCPDIVHLKVEESINEMKKVVPLLKMTWKETLQDWSKK
jgi:DNA polymerase I-like protein with 3'-5' exonuclease and polymerase domains